MALDASKDLLLSAVSGCGVIAQWLEGPVRKAGGPAFDSQVHCFNFFPFLRPDASAFFFLTGFWGAVNSMSLPDQDQPFLMIMIFYLNIFLLNWSICSKMQKVKIGGGCVHPWKIAVRMLCVYAMAKSLNMPRSHLCACCVQRWLPQ